LNFKLLFCLNDSIKLVKTSKRTRPGKKANGTSTLISHLNGTAFTSFRGAGGIKGDPVNYISFRIYLCGLWDCIWLKYDYIIGICLNMKYAYE